MKLAATYILLTSSSSSITSVKKEYNKVNRAGKNMINSEEHRIRKCQSKHEMKR